MLGLFSVHAVPVEMFSAGRGRVDARLVRSVRRAEVLGARAGWWMASVISGNFEGSIHAIVMRDGDVAFDPSPKPRRTPYRFVGETHSSRPTRRCAGGPRSARAVTAAGEWTLATVRAAAETVAQARGLDVRAYLVGGTRPPRCGSRSSASWPPASATTGPSTTT